MGLDLTGVPQTCPLIDDAISQMERVRSMNGELRDIANDALARCEVLEDEIADLRSDVARLRSELAEAEAAA